MNLEKFENHQHVVDSRDSAHNCTDQIIKYNSNHNKFLPHIDQEDRLLAKRHEYKKNIPLINNGLCVIINESKFKDKVLISDRRENFWTYTACSICYICFLYCFSMIHGTDHPQILLI